MRYQQFWADMHSNIHHHQMNQLPQWYEHAKAVMDFWPIAYYPFALRKTPSGAALEDLIPQKDYCADWETVRALAAQAEQEGWPFFMGYEWQGDGSDGDHNVFYLNNDEAILQPRKYLELRDQLAGHEAIAVPHHLAYKPDSRGKNWSTHDEKFSPIAEIYSSHGSSENDDGPIPMVRHVHMGPRISGTSYESGLAQGHHVSVIASGDNHAVPGEADHGMMCALAENNTKEAIWAALRSGRTYGVSRSRIGVDFSIGGKVMGETVPAGPQPLAITIHGTNAVDRIELLRDSIPEKTYVHSGSWERAPLPEKFRFKFEVEFGWGPDLKAFPGNETKTWAGSLRVPGTLLSVEKLWNSFGQRIDHQDDKGCDFNLITRQTSETGKWMGSSPTRQEGFIFEVEGGLDDVLDLTVNGKNYPLVVRDLLQGTRVYSEYEEAEKMVYDRYPDAHHYRDDLIWHSAFKFRVRRAAPESAYLVSINETLDLVPGSNYRLRVWQKNGDIAWSSPIYCE